MVTIVFVQRLLLDFRYFFADVFSEPIPARIGRTNAQEKGTKIHNRRSTNRWSDVHRINKRLRACSCSFGRTNFQNKVFSSCVEI